MTHFIKNNSTEQYAALRDFTVTMLTEFEGKSIEDLVAAKQANSRRTELSYDDALEEVIADGCEMMLKDSAAIETLARENKGLYNSVKAFVKSFVNAVKKAFQGVEANTEEARAMMKYADALQVVWDNALVQSVRNYNVSEPAQTEVNDLSNVKEKYELRENIEEQLNDWLKGHGKKYGSFNGRYFDVGTTPDVLIKHGSKSLRMIMYEDCVAKITGNKGDDAHTISLSEIAKLPAQLNDPVLLFKGSVENSFVALTEIVDKNGNDVVVAVHLDKKMDRTVINKIASLYSKSDSYGNNKIVNYVNSQIKSGNLIDASTKKAPNWFTSRGLQLPKLVQTILDANIILSQKDNDVNNRISNNSENVNKKFSERDSEGNKLSPEQQEFFKDSKVRDEDGNLLVVFHGTTEKFTVFDSSKSRSTMDIQGNFFSPWEDDAKGYGKNVDAYYLDIKNPANESIGYNALRMFKGQNYAGIKAREHLIGLGYDGVNNENEEYIAFNSNQIKRVTNTNPTKRDDIRYSERNYSYDTLSAKPDMKVTDIDTVNIPKSRADVIFYAKQNAAKIGKFNTKDGSVSVHVDDIDTNVVLGTNGLKHSLDRRFSENSPVTLKAGEILQNSIRINELVPQKAEAEQSYVLVGAARGTNQEINIVRFVVNRFSNEVTSMDVLYAINTKKESTAALNAPQVSTPSYRTTISISKLLDYVNKYFPDILPEDVLRHYGHTQRPSGNLGESALYQDRTPEYTNRQVLVNALENVESLMFDGNPIGGTSAFATPTTVSEGVISVSADEVYSIELSADTEIVLPALNTLNRDYIHTIIINLECLEDINVSLSADFDFFTGGTMATAEGSFTVIMVLYRTGVWHVFVTSTEEAI